MEALLEALGAIGGLGVVICVGLGIGLAMLLEEVVPPEHIRKVERGLKVLGTAAAGAAIGTAIAPGIGTVIGGVVGAVAGFFW